MSIDAMKQALEALERIDRQDDDDNFLYPHDAYLLDKAITALRLAIEQAEKQEPVAMRYDFDGYGYKYIDSGSGSNWQTRHKGAEPLYEAPPQRQPLTEEEATKLWRESVHKAALPPNRDALLHYKESIERAHGIGGGE